MASAFRRSYLWLSLSAAMPFLIAATGALANDGDEASGPSIRVTGTEVQITSAVKVGSLPALRDVVVRPGDFTKGPRVRDLDRLPRPQHAAAFENAMSGDRIVQTHAATSPLGVVVGSHVAGIGTGFVGPAGAFQDYYAPPDTVGAVGDTQYVQVVNAAFAVFDKATKKVLLGAIPTNALWQGFGGVCEQDNDGDGTVVYDKAAKRWLVSQFAIESTYAQCVAVSKTSDATGGWWLYEFDTPGTDFNDYPKMGVWPDAYYETFNLFGSAGFDGALACAYDRAKMLDGKPATQQCFNLPNYGGVLPSDLDGPTPPPKGTPNYLINYGDNSLNLWKFHVDWNNPAASKVGNPKVIPVAAFVGACDYGGACIQQKSTPLNKVDSLGDRMMYRLAYRNFGDHESLVASHSVDITGQTRPHTGVRWYELRSPGTTPVVYQQSTYAPDVLYRWMPSVAMDKAGDIAVGYSASGATSDPSVRFAARLESDPLDTLQAETLMIQGSGGEGQGLKRWGDYSAMTVDPVDDCTFWYTQEYIPADGVFNWSTQIGSFKLPTCN